MGGRNRMESFLQRSPEFTLLLGGHQVIRGVIQEDETALKPIAKVAKQGLEQMVEQFS